MAWLFRSLSQNKSKEDTTPKNNHPPPVTNQTQQTGDRTNAFYVTVKVELPPKFAQDLMDLEMEVELPNLTLDTVKKLMKLYQQGVEYFSSIRSDKYLIFKNKSQSLMLRDNVQQVLNQPQASTPKQSQVQEQLPARALSAIKQKTFDNSLNSQNPVQQVKTFMTSHRTEMEKINNLIVNDISDQQKRLQERIGKRMNDPSKVQFLMSKSSSLQVLKQCPTEDAIRNGTTDGLGFQFKSKKLESKKLNQSIDLNAIQENLDDNKEEGPIFHQPKLIMSQREVRGPIRVLVQQQNPN